MATTLIRNATVVATVDETRREIPGGGLFLRDHVIETVGPMDQLPPGWVMADIGPRTIELFAKELESSGTVLWNGPVGVFEIASFSNGTRALAQALAGLKAVTIAGGGSTAEAIHELGLMDKFTHVSTGGGASLEFLEGKDLPGIAALQDKGR